MSEFLNKEFVDNFDRNRKVVPFEEDGRDLICRVYIKEPKMAKTKVRREKEDGDEGETELVYVFSEIDVPFNYVGKARQPRSLFFAGNLSERDQLNRIGFRMK